MKSETEGKKNNVKKNDNEKIVSTQELQHSLPWRRNGA